MEGVRSLEGKRITVLAGGSHIGIQTIQALQDAGAEINATVRKDTDFKLLTRRSRRFPTVSVYRADVTDKDSLKEPLRRADGVLYLPALFGQGINDQRTLEVNIGGMENVVRVADEMGVQTLVNASSVAVYGDPRKQPRDSDGNVILTEESPTNAQSAYGYSKHISEETATISNISQVIHLRYAQLYGPETDAWSKKLIDNPYIFYLMLHTGSFLPVFIDDVVKANVAAFQMTGPVIETINVVGNESSTWKDMVIGHRPELREKLQALEILSTPLRGLAQLSLKELGSLMDSLAKGGKRVPVSRETFEIVFRRGVHMKNDKLRNLIGAENITPLSTGLEKTQAWARVYRSSSS